MEKLIRKFINNNEHKHLSVGIIINNRSYKFHYDKSGVVEKDYEYFIGSISKTFTAHLVTKYINACMLDPDTSCGAYLGIGNERDRVGIQKQLGEIVGVE